MGTKMILELLPDKRNSNKELEKRFKFKTTLNLKFFYFSNLIYIHKPSAGNPCVFSSGGS